MKSMLEASGINVRFGGAHVLSDVALSAPPGRITGLIGPNGAGKTTLFNVITGLLKPESGVVRLDGRDITGLAPHRRARLGLVRTFQRLEIFGSLTVRQTVQVAAEAARRWGAAGDVDALIGRTGLSADADLQADLLSTGRARILEIARALACNPKVLLLDEPASGLDEEETQELGGLLVELAGGGLTVLLVEHDVELVMRVCQGVSVLDFGSVIASGPPEAIRSDPAVRRAYLGAPDGTAHPGATVDPPPVVTGGPAVEVGAGAALPLPAAAHDPAPAPAIALDDVHAGYGRIEVLRGLTLHVPAGRVCALLGPNGVGKTTTLAVISGRLPITSGKVAVGGQRVVAGHTARLARDGLCLIPEGRGVFPNLTVLENLRMWTFRGHLDLSDVTERSFARFPRLGERRRQLAGTMSGGEQQMLALSRALCTHPEVLLLDEISMGLAPIVVAELYDVVGQLAEEGLTILLVEQFAKTALRVADLAATLSHGVIDRFGTAAEIRDALAEDRFALAEHSLAENSHAEQSHAG